MVGAWLVRPLSTLMRALPFCTRLKRAEKGVVLVCGPQLSVMEQTNHQADETPFLGGALCEFLSRLFLRGGLKNLFLFLAATGSEHLGDRHPQDHRQRSRYHRPVLRFPHGSRGDHTKWNATTSLNELLFWWGNGWGGVISTVAVVEGSRRVTGLAMQSAPPSFVFSPSRFQPS